MTVIDIRDELIAFYERRGYHRTGILKPFPYGDERFGLPMRDDLRFEVLEKALDAIPRKLPHVHVIREQRNLGPRLRDVRAAAGRDQDRLGRRHADPGLQLRRRLLRAGRPLLA